MKKYTQTIEVTVLIGSKEVTSEVELSVAADSLEDARMKLFSIERQACVTTRPLEKIRVSNIVI